MCDVGHPKLYRDRGGSRTGGACRQRPVLARLQPRNGTRRTPLSSPPVFKPLGFNTPDTTADQAVLLAIGPGTQLILPRGSWFQNSASWTWEWKTAAPRGSRWSSWGSSPSRRPRRGTRAACSTRAPACPDIDQHDSPMGPFGGRTSHRWVLFPSPPKNQVPFGLVEPRCRASHSPSQ